MALTDGLVAHYLLNNNSSDYVDSLDGTDIDMAYNGYFAEYNGTSSYVNTNHAYYTTTMTISLWVKAVADGAINIFLSRRGGSSSNYEGIELGVGSDNALYYRFDAGGGTSINSTGSETFVSNKWTHYVMQVDLPNQKVRVYADGALVREATQTEDCNWTGSQSGYINAWLFGRRTPDASPDFMEGSISNVRFYSDAKDQAFVDDLYKEGRSPKLLTEPTTSGLVAHYPLTSTAEDSTGNYDGTESGNTYVNDVEFGSVASFDGADSYILSSYEINSKMSISFTGWFRVSTSGLYCVITDYISSDFNLLLFVDYGVVTAQNRYSGSSVSIGSGGGFNDGKFHHFAATIDVPSLELSLTVDNTHINTTTISSNAWGGD